MLSMRSKQTPEEERERESNSLLWKNNEKQQSCIKISFQSNFIFSRLKIHVERERDDAKLISRNKIQKNFSLWEEVREKRNRGKIDREE